MTELTITDLTALLLECAGEPLISEGDILDLTFAELGYDSLAVLQVTGRIEREHNLALDEEDVAAAESPREYLALINEAFTARVTG